MIAIKRAGNGGESDIGGTAVARFANDIRKLSLPLSFANHGFISGSDAGGEAARAADLRMRPGHVVGRAQIRTVRHIHAAGGANENGIVARRFAGHPVLDRGPAAGAGSVPRDERLGLRQLRIVKTRTLVRDFRELAGSAALLLWLPYQFLQSAGS